VRAERDFVIGGGKTLQPVLYALVAERLLGQPVEAGRLYYCTAAGGYEERVVPLNDAARVAIAELAQVVGAALAEGFMPAAPDDGECRYCDYRRVCGPHEELRVRRKTVANGVEARLKGLRQLREHK
jgi:CRISPR/Cas system-associated exonuclease Cas4 (RecB family)